MSVSDALLVIAVLYALCSYFFQFNHVFELLWFLVGLVDLAVFLSPRI